MKIILSLCALIITLHISLPIAAEVSDRIIGANDLIAVNAQATNIPFRYRKLVNAFGKIDMGCTATHIGKGYVITAGHCFWAGPAGQANQNCEEKIEWGLRSDNKAYMVSKCEKIILAQMTEYVDYALIKVSPIPPESISINLITSSKPGDRLTLFSHPDELPLHWSQKCSVRRTINLDLPTNALQHQCDTNLGSSGGALLDANTLQIVGIHNGGNSNLFGAGMNYGTNIVDTPLPALLKKLGF